MRKPIPIELRLWDRGILRDTGCIEWSAAFRNGYGVIWHNGRHKGAHRASFEVVYGKIPSGLFVCHSCDNKKCINPEHLYLGTNQDNQLDAVARGLHRTNPHNARKTQCPKGHSYDSSNTYIRPDNARGCKMCIKASNLKWKGRVVA